jgi:alpha-glucosidase
MAEFGYDIADFCDVDPLFGTLDDFKELLTAAQSRGIRVLIDLVPNHTSDVHKWFLDSKSSRESYYRDWYVWRDAKSDGSAPNNWLSAFGGSAWTHDEKTGQYYLHSFLDKQPDLNWDNPAVREAIKNVMRFWLDLGRWIR